MEDRSFHGLLCRFLIDESLLHVSVIDPWVTASCGPLRAQLDAEHLGDDDVRLDNPGTGNRVLGRRFVHVLDVLVGGEIELAHRGGAPRVHRELLGAVVALVGTEDRLVEGGLPGLHDLVHLLDARLDRHPGHGVDGPTRPQ